MSKKKPCCICGRWFLPNRRVGNRQRACSKAECQRERHRRNCARWHTRNPDYDREGRLRRELIGERGQNRDANGVETDPLGQVNEEVARDLVGLQLYVVIDEIAKVVVSWTRDLVHEKTGKTTGQTGKQGPLVARDEIVRARAPT
jgi:hypothetical protein